MKKFLSLLAVVAMCLMMASCQTENDKACADMAKACAEGNQDAVAKAAAALYSQKEELSEDNLADLAIAFHFLAQKEAEGRNDATYLTDYIEKALDCYMGVYSADADNAAKIFKDKGYEKLGDQLNQMKKQLKELQEAEQALLEQINS